MPDRPRDIAERISDRRERVTLTLPVEAARAKAREIIAQAPQAGQLAIVENWCQLPDGQIELTMRRLRTED